MVDTTTDDSDLNESKRVFVHPTDLPVQSPVSDPRSNGLTIGAKLCTPIIVQLTGILGSPVGDKRYLPTALSVSSLAIECDVSAILADESSTFHHAEESRGRRSPEAVTVPMSRFTANVRTNPMKTACCSPRSDSSGLAHAPGPEAADRFEPLVSVIVARLRRNNHDLRVPRTIVGEDLIKKYPMVYADLDIGSFKQYSQEAEKAGIVELGGVPPKLWIQLKSRL